MRYLLFGGLVVGVLDIVYAIGFWWFRARVAPMRILQSVAAGLIGRDAARAGGLQTALLGAFLHFFIAFAIVVVYWLAAKRIRILVQSPTLCGLIYGVLVYLAMNYVVIPLSAAPGGGAKLTTWIVWSVIVHALCVGVPASLFARQAVINGPPTTSSS
jgi:hypothetical protein